MDDKHPDAWPASIAIDGPAGSGKTTVARLVAARLGYLYVDTGAMYRAVTLRVLRQGAALAEESLTPLLADVRLRLGLAAEAGLTPVWLDNQRVDGLIRGAQVTRHVSAVSAHHLVRRAMVALQREIGNGVPVVMEGRDIGTVVLPGATTKVLLTASLAERARRRARETVARGTKTTPMAQYWALRRRDRFDRTRADSPLRLAPGATVVDSTRLGPAEVADRIVVLHAAHTGGCVL